MLDVAAALEHERAEPLPGQFFGRPPSADARPHDDRVVGAFGCAGSLDEHGRKDIEVNARTQTRALPHERSECGPYGERSEPFDSRNPVRSLRAGRPYNQSCGTSGLGFGFFSYTLKSVSHRDSFFNSGLWPTGTWFNRPPARLR